MLISLGLIACWELELEAINLTVNEKAAETYQGLWGLASLQGCGTRMKEV